MNYRDDIKFEDAQRGDLITGTSDQYNSGKEFTGNISRVRGTTVFFSCKNGRSRKAMDISAWNEYIITGYRA